MDKSCRTNMEELFLSWFWVTTDNDNWQLPQFLAELALEFLHTSFHVLDVDHQFPRVQEVEYQKIFSRSWLVHRRASLQSRLYWVPVAHHSDVRWVSKSCKPEYDDARFLQQCCWKSWWLSWALKCALSQTQILYLSVSCLHWWLLRFLQSYSSCSPFADRGTSVQPVNLFSWFHVLSPCLTNTTRWA